MAWLSAVVAAAARASAAQAQSRAVSLHMAEALAVIALLGLGSTGQRAAVGLVAGLLTCILSSVVRVMRASGKRIAYSCSRDAQQRSKLRRSGQHCRTCSRRDERGKTF
ncbi:hypothetical protein LZ31DRAFT_332738 [Colletotrichum somersetense]|nr:hypothetical protein LZ31DRAFT_332738 [Colletotrichum somersetense]